VRDDETTDSEATDPETVGAERAELETPRQATQPAVTSNERSGLELARSIAAALRGGSRRRPGHQLRTARRSAATELSGAHPDARDPTGLGAAVDRLVVDSGWTTDVAVHGVFGRWDTIVGADVAAHCTPESFQDGHLRVRTDSTAWATQLRLLVPTVVRRLNEELGHGTVLRIDVAGPESPSWRRGPRSVRDGRGPRDTYG
jgi:predicted nucleic acid-binding Zn ribbon protein